MFDVDAEHFAQIEVTNPYPAYGGSDEETAFDARQRIAIWKLDSYEDSIVEDNTNSNKIQEVNYVYDLFDSKHNDIMENYVIDYIRFDFDCIVIAIKPDKWNK